MRIDAIAAPAPQEVDSSSEVARMLDAVSMSATRIADPRSDRAGPSTRGQAPWRLRRKAVCRSWNNRAPGSYDSEV
jgi:hypothetical protein